LSGRGVWADRCKSDCLKAAVESRALPPGRTVGYDEDGSDNVSIKNEVREGGGKFVENL